MQPAELDPFREATLHALASASAHIVTLVDVYADPHAVYMVMQLMQGGELFDVLAEKEFLSEAEAVTAVTSLLQSVKSLHALRIAHRCGLGYVWINVYMYFFAAHCEARH